MANPYRARVDERAFLNLPGFHGGAYVYAYVEDTSERDAEVEQWEARTIVEPRTILEIADCEDRISLEFEVSSELHVENSLHKLDTLVAALLAFRAGLVAEAALHAERRRQREAHARGRRRRRGAAPSGAVLH